MHRFFLLTLPGRAFLGGEAYFILRRTVEPILVHYWKVVCLRKTKIKGPYYHDLP